MRDLMPAARACAELATPCCAAISSNNSIITRSLCAHRRQPESGERRVRMRGVIGLID